jgi:putative hydrolase of the HAD superfamily
MRTVVIEAVLFDLDDTLFEQRYWLSGAWRAVAEAARHWGIDPHALRRALDTVAAEGSDRGRIIDRALESLGATDVPVESLVDAFRRHRPSTLPAVAGAVDALLSLRRRAAIALVTDGDPMIQRGKLTALNMNGVFHTVVLSDELGRAHRKPDSLPFQVALDRLGVAPDAAVYIGDRPDKDTAGAAIAGLRAVRVRTGEYRKRPDRPRPWRSARDVTHAVELLEPFLATPRGRATG